MNNVFPFLSAKDGLLFVSLFPFSFFLAIIPSFSQITETELKLNNRDFCFWSDITLEKNLTQKFRATIQQELRLDDNATTFQSTFSEISLRYKLIPFLHLQANYRFSILPVDVGIVEFRHRVSFDAILRFRKQNSPLQLNNRTTFQKTFYLAENPTNYIRNKLELNYNLSRLVDPFIAGELFYRIYNKPDEIQRYRLFFGLDWRIDGRRNLSTFYLFQKEINVINPEINYIFGLSFNYRLP